MTNNIEDWRNLVLYVFRNKNMLFSDKINKTKEVTAMDAAIVIFAIVVIYFIAKGRSDN